MAEDDDESALGKSYDASDPKQVKAARKKSKREAQNRQNVQEAIMQHYDGRKWLWEWMQSCYMFTDPVVPGDAYLTYLNLGRQLVGKRLLADAMEYSDLYVLMAKEARERDIK